MNNQLNEQFQPQEQTTSTRISSYVSPAPTPGKPICKIIFSIIGIIGGIVSIIVGITTVQPNYISLDNMTFGGDAYTAIYQAAQYTAGRTGYIDETLSRGIKYAFIIAGVMAICYFALELLKAMEFYKNQKNEQRRLRNNINI